MLAALTENDEGLLQKHPNRRWRRPNSAKRGDYFCQVRFLWRLARNCLRRLCLLIFDFRRFFSDPI
jgi:hypothetical protein